MESTWSTFRELLVPAVDGTRPGRGLERALRDEIRAGRLHAGTRLPSSRDMAGQLGVARGTVSAAYDQLVAEGYLVAQRGSGTRVAPPRAPERTADSAPELTARRGSWRYNLGPGLPSLAAFPRSAWLASIRAGMAELPDLGLGYPDTSGLPGLRAELAKYLGRVRAVVANADDVVVTHGTFDALGLLFYGLRTQGHTRVAIEDPGGPDLAELLIFHGLRPVWVPVDNDGLQIDALARTKCRAIVVTAAHQYPLGVALSPERRRGLAEWASKVDGLVIEDDYDAEYRYDRAALGAVQGMDPSRVAYVGTVSKTLAPALRLGWLVAPPALRAEAVIAKWFGSRGCSTFEQVGFEHFLRTGGYDRHLRSTRPEYRRRRDAFLAALAKHLPDWEPIGIDAGLHVVIRLPDSYADAELAALLESRHQIHVGALSSYSHSKPLFPALVTGFASLTPDRFDDAIATLAAAIKSV
jgi:GntR family transcriptional regulator/MocR family aminotransferase